jgi:hypothetical protein
LSFITGTQMELFYGLSTSVTNNTFTTQRVVSAGTTLPRCILPPNFFSYQGIGKALYVQAAGTLGDTSTAPTYTFVFGIDPTPGTLGTSVTCYPSTTLPFTSTTVGWNLELLITCQAVGEAGTTLQVDGEYSQGTVATNAVNATSSATSNVMIDTNLTTLDSEESLALELWGTFGTSNAANQVIVKQFWVFGCN